MVETITAFVCTLVAGMSLLLPIDFGWTSKSTALQLDMLAFSVPRAIAVGGVVAVLISVFATTMNHAMAAWGSALAGIAIMFINHLAGRHASPAAPLSTLNFVDSIAGGMLLGGIAAAVLRGRMQVFGWTLGALASVVVAAALPVPHSVDLMDPRKALRWPATDSPPMWLIEIALVLVVIGTVVNRHSIEIERRTVELPMAPILAGMLYISVALFSAEWLAHRDASAVNLALAVATTVLTAMVAAMLLPRRDGTLVLLAVAVSSVGCAIVPAELPRWTAPILIVVVAVGIVLGIRRPAPVLALLVLACLALFGVLTTPGWQGPLHATILGLVLALAAGYSFGCAAPRYNPTRVLGVAIVLGSSVVLALRDHLSSGDFGTATIEAGQWSPTEAPMVHSANAFEMALAITICCAVGLLMLRHWRAPVVIEMSPQGADSQPPPELPEDS